MHFSHVVKCDLFDDLSHLPTVNQDALLNLPAAQPSLCDLEITISYRRREMLKTQVSGPMVQLHYQCDVPEPNAQTLCVPSTDGLLDHKQVGVLLLFTCTTICRSVYIPVVFQCVSLLYTSETDWSFISNAHSIKKH